MEWLQRGQPEEMFTRLYRRFLRSTTKRLYQQLETLLEQHYEAPAAVLVVATHFGLAHQVAAIKDKISLEKGINIILALQVTDDSPQRIWYVAGADLIAVPSEQTKAALLNYGKLEHLPHVHFEVLPYPLSPLLTEMLTKEEYKRRLQQVRVDGLEEIQVVIPISGAAVGLTFFRRLINALYSRSNRFRFHVVAKAAPYTQGFLRNLRTHPSVTLHTATTDREIIEKYDQLYRTVTVTLEITKPSEQAFKALISPQRQGGALLLFSHPVGRQEYDNLKFLERHHLLPTMSQQQQLWECAAQNKTMNGEDSAVLSQALTWRGIRLPDDPLSAANSIWWSLQQGLFNQMLRCMVVPQPDDPAPRELTLDGVSEFWKTVSALLGR
jgi:hypothetical protein